MLLTLGHWLKVSKVVTSVSALSDPGGFWLAQTDLLALDLLKWHDEFLVACESRFTNSDPD